MKELELIEEYKAIFKKKENRPNWAVKKKSAPNDLVHPSIPFVGKNYESTKLLIYASAENLNYYKKEESHLDYEENSINRHRYCFEKYNKSSFYPHLHIEPFNNGALMVLTAYVVNHLLKKDFNSTKELAENIAIANFGKFSIETDGANIDYANDLNYLKYSLPFIEKDLELLTPEIIILPKSIYYNEIIKKKIKDIVPKALILPIRQMTPTTINTQLNKKFVKKKNIPTWLIEWHENIGGKIKGKTKENYYSVYSYLDKLLNDRR